MEELNIKISKIMDGHYYVQPIDKGEYDSKSFWVARITGVHPQYGFAQKFIQKGTMAVLDSNGYYVICCDFVKTYIIVEGGEYRLSNYNEIRILLTMWG